MTRGAIQRLTLLEAGSPALERGGVPCSIGWAGMVRLPGEVSDHLDALRGHVDGRMQSVPRSRQRVLRVPHGCRLPVWVDDAAFGIDRHPPGALDMDAVVPGSGLSEQDRSPDDRLAGHASTRVPRTTPDTRVADALTALHGRRFDSVRDIAVCDGDRLVGLLRVEDLLAAGPGAVARDLMDPDPPVIGPGIDAEAAAWHAARHGESSLLLVDAERRFLGIVPPHHLVGLLLAEHEEDVARVAGLLGSADPALSASREPLRRRLAHRLPWLLLGLAGALVSAGVVGAFEQRLSANIAVMAFVPGIVYMADAVGTQTEALVLRGLSVGVGIRGIVSRELLTGLVVGFVLAAAFVPLGLLGWGDPRLVAAVAAALLGACATATVIALALPALLLRLGVDPAFGSGPLATVVQDLLSLLIYFAVATAIVV